ncbi:MAG: LysR family transcriptional regulator [Alphaproteobacteria bacterium]|nr:LysR family transcriptional regulator [Alphaproteobacteria bacterium]
MNSRLIKLVQASPFLATLHTCGNFTRAAEMMGVHQTAVSHRVRALEDMLGIQLFERTTRALKFTHAGELLCRAAHASVTDLEDALDRIMQARNSSTIRVSVPPSMAMKWMVPKLTQARSAGLALSVQAQTKLVDFTRGEADIAIRYGIGPYPGLHCLRLGTSYMQALASPAYIQAKGVDPAAPWTMEHDILMDHVTETDQIPFGWLQFSESEPAFTQGFDDPVSRFDRTDLALQAAMTGLGVALGRSLLYEQDVENGFLVPLGRPHAVKPTDWLVCSHEFAQTRKYKTFAAWLQQEIADTRAIMDSFFPSDAS